MTSDIDEVIDICRVVINVIRIFKIVIKNVIEIFIKTFVEIAKDLIKKMNFNAIFGKWWKQIIIEYKTW